MRDASYWAQLDETIREETNVKQVRQYLSSTEKGDLFLVWDGEYRFMIGDEDVTTDALLKSIPKIKEAMYK